jgi:mannose-6-phosphate isomerase-like protein (cupin superfamily)
MEKRVFINPGVKDKVTFIKYAEETHGEYTLVEIEVEPGGGNRLHYHKTFSEKFTGIEGTITVRVGLKFFLVAPGETITVGCGMNHRFYNETGKPARFNVELRPGSKGMENFIKILCGLATDGLSNKRGEPKNLSHFAVAIEQGDTRAPGIYTLLHPLIHWLAKRARKNGLEKELIDRYCQ